MRNEKYKNSLKETVQALVKANDIIFDSLINVETQDDLKEWNLTVPEGEVHQFDFEIFRNSADVNVQLIVKVIETIADTIQSIMNINDFDLDEDEE